jgi:hypothetical protein
MSKFWYPVGVSGALLAGYMLAMSTSNQGVTFAETTVSTRSEVIETSVTFSTLPSFCVELMSTHAPGVDAERLFLRQDGRGWKVSGWGTPYISLWQGGGGWIRGTSISLESSTPEALQLLAAVVPLAERVTDVDCNFWDSDHSLEITIKGQLTPIDIAFLQGIFG